jgi:hypothetical protein
MKDRIILFIVLIAFLMSVLLASLCPQISLAEIRFEDVSRAAGIHRWVDSYGASWGDVNGDGWPDLWVGNHGADPSLYLNKTDGTFTDIAESVKNYNSYEQHGAAWADFDNDGDQDLILIVGGSMEAGVHPNQFFINSGGLLQNRASDYGLEYPLGRGRTPLWFDWNSDGYLDLFVTNLNRYDREEAPSVLFTRQDHYFRNDNALFPEAPPSSQLGQIFFSTFLDTPALVVYGHGSPFPIYSDPHPNKFYKNMNSHFQDVTDKIKLPGIYDVKDVAIADFNNDLLNDFFMTTAVWGGTYLTKPDKKEDHLLIQTSDGFQDATAAAGLEISTSCWSVTSADFDNDMDIDLYLVCSGIYCNTPNILYENLSDGTLQAVAKVGGAEGSSYGRGDSVAAADYNNDGFIDLYVTNRKDAYKKETGHNQLYRNVGNSNHWLEIELEGVISNRDGIGSLILASSGGKTQMRVQGSGIHRVSQDHQRIHFGLANNTLVEKLIIQWPSGIVQKIDNIAADQIIKITELDFTVSTTNGTAPLAADFTSNIKGFYKPLRYEWDFDNNGSVDATVQNPSYMYKKSGTYTVKLRVTDTDGRVFTSVRNDYINIQNTE